MPRKTTVTPTTSAAKPKTARTAVVEVIAKPRAEVVAKPRAAQRVTTVKHSKAAAPVAVETVKLSAHDQIAQIAYGYWEARGFQPGSPEQDWMRAEQEYLLQA
jgi:hypothetical protein